MIELESTNIPYLTISGQVRLVTSGFIKTSFFLSIIYFFSRVYKLCAPYSKRPLSEPPPHHTSDKLWLVSVTCLWDNSSCFISVCVRQRISELVCVWVLFSRREKKVFWSGYIVYGFFVQQWVSFLMSKLEHLSLISVLFKDTGNAVVYTMIFFWSFFLGNF